MKKNWLKSDIDWEPKHRKDFSYLVAAVGLAAIGAISLLVGMAVGVSKLIEEVSKIIQSW
jgi:hypothetical protein